MFTVSVRGHEYFTHPRLDEGAGFWAVGLPLEASCVPSLPAARSNTK